MSDSNQIIGATIQVDTGNSNQNVQALNKNLGDVKSSLKDTGAVASNTGKAIEESGGSFGKLKEQMTSLPGPLGQAGEGVSKLSAAFKALLANPVVLLIVALVAALALLYKAFTNSFEGGEKMEQVFAGIKAAAQALFDNLGHIASAIVKFFSLDFSGAVAEIKAVANAAVDAYNKMSELTKQAQDLHKEQLVNDLEAAKRAGQLADLREKLADPSIGAAEKKKIGAELLQDEIVNGGKSIENARKITENKIAQLTLQKEGALKNRDEINKLNIEEINLETAHSNELRRIAKANIAADRQDKADKKAAAAAAAAASKEERQKLVEYTNKLLKLQQDNELAQTRDAYAKETQALENKIADEKRAEDLAFQEKKITRAQYNELQAAIDLKASLERDQLRDKHAKEVAIKEEAFQKDLQGILAKIKEDGETDARVVERIKLQVEHDQKLADAVKAYADDAVKFQAIKQALDAKLKADQDKLDDKFKKEDAQKKLKIQEEQHKKVIDDKKAAYDDRLKAVDDEQALVKAAFDQKVITELEYNTKVDALAKARQAIHDEEQKNTERVASAIGQTFGNLATLAGKQTALGKAFAIAQATIDTYSGAVKAYNAMADIPVIGPALGVVAAAAAIAAGVENVKKILAVQVPGQGSGGSAPTAPATAAAPVAPVQAGTTLNAGSINAIGNATSGRTYVLDSDVQNNADRNARLNRAARLGG